MQHYCIYLFEFQKAKELFIHFSSSADIQRNLKASEKCEVEFVVKQKIRAICPWKFHH